MTPILKTYEEREHCIAVTGGLALTPEFVVAANRGRLWLDHPRSGFLHRSPPIEGMGETRPILVLDPVDDPEGAD